MAAERPKDPGEVFRDLVTEWERGFDKLANTLMGTESYSRSMNQMQDVQMAVRNAFREFMTQNLTNANMPTRDDLVRLGESVLAIERRLEKIEGMLAGITQRTASPTSGPPRTRQPPSGGAS